MNSTYSVNLKEPIQGQPVDAAWGKAVVKAIKSLAPIAGTGMTVSQTPNGTVYTSTAKTATKTTTGEVKGGEAVICEVTGGNSTEGFDGVAFTYVDESGRLVPGGGACKMLALEYCLDGSLPAGSLVVGHKFLMAMTGGND